MGLLNSIFKFIKEKSISFAILIVFVGAIGWIKYFILPSSVTTLIETMSESYGLDITVSDLTTEIIDLKVNLEDVVWHVDGRYSSNELFTADQISFNLSIVKYFFNGFNIVPALSEIVVRDAKLHIEHKNSNQWNWQHAVSGRKILRYINGQYQNSRSLENTSEVAQDEPNQYGDGSDFSFSAIKFDGLGIVWIEELPSNSRDGIIVRSRSELFIDDVSLIVRNIVGVFQNSEQPMEIDFDGRTADGIIQASGEVNLFSWGAPKSALNGTYTPVA